MTARIPVHSNRWLIPDVTPRIALSGTSRLMPSPYTPSCRLVRQNVWSSATTLRRSRQLHTYMRTNLEEIQRTEQTDAALTKIKARGEQRIECSKRRPQNLRGCRWLCLPLRQPAAEERWTERCMRCRGSWPRRECHLGQTRPIETSLRCYSSNRFALPRTFLPPYDAASFSEPFSNAAFFRAIPR